jgi:hypothetical protein
MGFIGNLLGGAAGSIGEFIDKNVFGGTGKTGRSIGEASSNLIRLLPFEAGGMVHFVDPRTGKIVRSVKKKAPAKKAPAKKAPAKKAPKGKKK